MSATRVKPFKLEREVRRSIDESDRELVSARDGSSIGLIGEGPISFIFLREAILRGANIRSYLHLGSLPAEIPDYWGVNTMDFSGDSSYDIFIGREDFTAVFNFSKRIPGEYLDNQRVIGLHPSRLPEFAGEKDPVRKLLGMQGKHWGDVTAYLLNEELDLGDLLGMRQYALRRAKEDNEERLLRTYVEGVIPAAASLLSDVVGRFDELIPRDQFDLESLGGENYASNLFF